MTSTGNIWSKPKLFTRWQQQSSRLLSVLQQLILWKWWFVMCVFGCYRRQEMQQMRGMKRPHDGAAAGWPAETKRPAMPSAGYIPSATRHA